jgi:hypothetical protein
MKNSNIVSLQLDAKLNSTQDEQECNDQKLTIDINGVVAVALVV